MLESHGDGIDIIYMADDYCSKDAPLFSPEDFQEFVVPYLSKFADIIHKHNKKFLLHVCGAVRPLLPMIIDAGVRYRNGRRNMVAVLSEQIGFGISLELVSGALFIELKGMVWREQLQVLSEQVFPRVAQQLLGGEVKAADATGVIQYQNGIKGVVQDAVIETAGFIKLFFVEAKFTAEQKQT